MYTFNDFYINGEWVKPQDGKTCEVINPATEKVSALSVSVMPPT